MPGMAAGWYSPSSVTTNPAGGGVSAGNGLTPTQAATQMGNLKGQVAGATEAGFLSSLPPSLQGLYGGLSSAVAGTGTTPSTGTGSTSIPGVAGTGTAPPPVPQISTPDTTASNAQAFARAKDTVGQTSRASLDALNGELGSKGMLGGGAEVQGATDIINAGQENLGQVATGQAETNAQTAEQNAIENATLASTGRGQDIQLEEAQANEALAANNQQFQQSYLRQQQIQNMLNMALAGLNNPMAGQIPGLTPVPNNTVG